MRHRGDTRGARRFEPDSYPAAVDVRTVNDEAGGPPGPPASKLRALLVVSVPFLAESTRAATAYRLFRCPYRLRRLARVCAKPEPRGRAQDDWMSQAVALSANDMRISVPP